MLAIISNENIHINDSYLIKSPKKMEETINQLRRDYIESDSLTFRRSNKSMINEWCGHNLLYYMGLFRTHTKDVDLEYNSNIFKATGYWFLKIIYKMVYKKL